VQYPPRYDVNVPTNVAPSRVENERVVPRVQLGAEATRHIALFGWNFIVVGAHVREHGFAYVVLEPDPPLARLRWLAAGGY